MVSRFNQLLLLISLVLMHLVAIPATAANANKYIIPTPTIVVFGDSLSAAYGIQQRQGWVSLLEKQLITDNYHYKVVNASISGETTSGGLSRFSTMLAEHKPAVVIIELGGNDGLRGLSASDVMNNLDQMMLLAKNSKAAILLLGMKIPPNYGLKYSAVFSANYEKLAKKHRAVLVPFFLEHVAGMPELLQADGIHPNAIAQPQLLKNSWPTLEKMLKKSH